MAEPSGRGIVEAVRRLMRGPRADLLRTLCVEGLDEATAELEAAKAVYDEALARLLVAAAKNPPATPEGGAA